MTIDELKKQIVQRAGIPANLLAGETAEEVITRAKAVLTYKRQHEDERSKTTEELFADWIGAQLEESNIGQDYKAQQKYPSFAALADIAESVRVEAGGYPQVADSGDPYINGIQGPDGRSTAEQFADWFKQGTAFDPFKDADGWKRIV